MSDANPFEIAKTPAGGMVQVAQSKEAQQIQAQLVVAKKFPRDQHASFQRIIEACKRVGLAEEATYLYYRGGQTITGASIRLLEVVAQCWGNFRSGIVELDNEDGESRVEAFAWDLETNAYDSKTFTVKHERYSKESGITKLTEQRDVYEHVANFAARRKRACMEAVIPRDVIDSAIDQCEKTLKSGHTEPITDRVRKIVTAFSDMGVTVEMLEKRLQHKLEATIEQEVVLLRKIYTSLKDGAAKREDFFEVGGTAPKPAKFEPKEPKKEEAAAEAAAGLAPAQRTEAPQPETPAAGKRGRKPQEPASTPATAAATSSPAPTPEPAAPPVTPPAAAAPEPEKKLSPLFGDATKKADPTAEPEKAPAAAPQQPAAEPQPAAPAGEPGKLTAEQAYNAVMTALGTSQVTEEEVLAVLKTRKLCPANIEQLIQISDDILIDLASPESMKIITGQVRINRRFKK